MREDKLIPSDKHTGTIKFHLGIQNLLLQNERKKINPFLYKETLFTVLKIIFTIIFGLLVFEQHWAWSGKMFISPSIPSAINCNLISLSLQDLWFPVNRMCIFTLTTTKQERVVIINGRGVFLIFRGWGHAGFQLNFNIIIIKAYISPFAQSWLVKAIKLGWWP